ncbi:MAG: serine/threonine protein kinase, partial [Gemmatimonadales bacterium]
IVHRDLKPDNIMIARGRDGSDLVKVVDFGIAKASSSDAQKVTKTGLVVGTPEYMSPEQLAGDKLDGRSDIYSLGLVAFNCLTGLLPFPSNSAQEAMIMRLTDEPKTLAEMKPGIQWPKELQAVMDKVLARDADKRYQKSAEFGRDIARAVENMPSAVAAAAGTLVMGAPDAGTLVTGAAAEVPKTRMAAKSGATVKTEAVAPAAATLAVPAAAPARKSPVMMIVAAVVVIAGIGGAAIFMKGGGSATPPVKSDAPTPPASNPNTTATDGKAADTKTAGSPNAAPGGSAAAQKDPVKPLSKELAKAPATATDQRKNPVTTPATPAPSAKEILSKWQRIVNADPTATDAQNAIDALNPLIEKLTGADRSMALYVEMVAYVRLDDDAQVCRVSNAILAANPDQSLVEGAKGAQKGRNCK